VHCHRNPVILVVVPFFAVPQVYLARALRRILSELLIGAALSAYFVYLLRLKAILKRT